MNVRFNMKNTLLVSKIFNKIANKILVHLSLNANHIVPKTRFGDRFVSYIDFMRVHKRLPRKIHLFNDVLFDIKTSNELLDPLRVFVTDKEFVKMFVKAVVGDKYNVPTFAVLRSIEDIDKYIFPPDCCIKSTSGSGQTILRRNNSCIDISEVKSWLSQNFYEKTREINYKYLKSKIIVEPLLFGSTNLNDYKFFCVNGNPKLVQVDADRYIEHKRTLLDMDWNEQDYSLAFPKANQKPVKPNNFAEMVDVVKCLSAHFSFIRVDLYSNGDDCFVGEITNCHGNASEVFIPLCGEEKASSKIFSGAYPFD